MAHNYIGYATLEGWGQAIDKSQCVFASAITSPGAPGTHGIRHDTAEIICTQPDNRGNVHYCRLSVGSWQELSGSPDFGQASRDKAFDRQESAWEIVKQWLNEQGFTTRNAVVAFPKSLRYLDGWADFLRYDKESGRFTRKELSGG
jgi:hypothetical protein